MVDQQRHYNEAVMRFVRNTNPTENTIQQWERDYPGLRFRDYGHDRTGVLANINKTLEKFIYGRTYDREQIPDAMQRNGMMNLVSILNSLRANVGSAPVGRNVGNNSATQSNINPATGVSEFFDPGATTPPSPGMLSIITRQTARNPSSRPQRWETDPFGRRIPQDAQAPMRAVRLDRYDPNFDIPMMNFDRLWGGHSGPGGNVLVPANRTPTQSYTAAEIVQQNPELARHLGLLKAIRGE